jgi:dipeptide transport system permease protein
VALVAGTLTCLIGATWAAGGISARLARHGHLAPDRHLDGLSAGAVLDPADRGDRAGAASIIIAIVVIDWTRFARVVRAEAMTQGAMDYVASAQVAGRGRLGTMLAEILPNVLPTIVVLLTLEMGIAVIVEAILSFVNLSISTDDPTWGGMIAEGRTSIHQAWWVLVFPLITLFLTVLSFSQLGEGLKDRFDPVLR